MSEICHANFIMDRNKTTWDPKIVMTAYLFSLQQGSLWLSLPLLYTYCFPPLLPLPEWFFIIVEMNLELNLFKEFQREGLVEWLKW
jgi:hypothetical protein